MHLLDKDSEITEHLTNDLMIPKLVELLKTLGHGKRRFLCEILYSFIQKIYSSRLKCIHTLHDTLEDTDELTFCISIFVDSEHQYQSELFDVFTYYGLLGLQHRSPHLRVASLKIFNKTIDLGYNQMILTILPQIKQLSLDD